MDTFLEDKKKKKGVNLGLIGGVGAALIVIAGLVFLFSLMSPSESEVGSALDGAYLEGSKEFEAYTRNLIVTTNTDRLMQSRTGLGTITMHIGGSVYNKGDRVLDVGRNP